MQQGPHLKLRFGIVGKISAERLSGFLQELEDDPDVELIYRKIVGTDTKLVIVKEALPPLPPKEGEKEQ